MKIGVFDSGLGGLIILKSLTEKLPGYEYVYLGDTKRTPYGSRSNETVYGFLVEAVEFLFKQDCLLVIVACNTASGYALRKVQQEYLPKKYPDRRVLGVIIPTAEIVCGTRDARRVGIVATQSTVNYGAFEKEILKINPKIKIYQQAAPLLVPFVEQHELKLVEPVLKKYLRPLLQKNIQLLVLGCTHYPILESKIKKIAGPKVKVISQTKVIPEKLGNYLKRHPEINDRLSKKKKVDFFITDMTLGFQKLSKQWFKKKIVAKVIDLSLSL